MPYVIISDELYKNKIGRYQGYAGEPANLVQIRGKKTLVLKASDIVLKAKQPAPSFLNQESRINRRITSCLMASRRYS